MANFLELQDKIGYEFKQEKLLRQALTHSSFANEKHLRKHSDNERLEFLGDAVLEIVSSDFLYKAYPDKSEGQSCVRVWSANRRWQSVPERWNLANICSLERAKI